jgi:uncharacterized protein YecE (DUF72 family)
LAEYASHAFCGAPLFCTGGLDHSFYRPAGVLQLAHYAEQAPNDFCFCSKVWEEITIPAYTDLTRYGVKAGKPNPRFLDTAAFCDLVLRPAQEELQKKLGQFIFEFQRRGTDAHRSSIDMTAFSRNFRLAGRTRRKSAIPRSSASTIGYPTGPRSRACVQSLARHASAARTTSPHWKGHLQPPMS